MKKLTKKQQQMVMENQGLIHQMAKEMNISCTLPEYQDIVSIANIALIRAVKRFDTRKERFSTYACTCIKNAMRLYYRQKNKEKNVISVISIYNFISKDKQGNIIVDTLRGEEVA